MQFAHPAIAAGNIVKDTFTYTTAELHAVKATASNLAWKPVFRDQKHAANLKTPDLPSNLKSWTVSTQITQKRRSPYTNQKLPGIICIEMVCFKRLFPTETTKSHRVSICHGHFPCKYPIASQHNIAPGFTTYDYPKAHLHGHIRLYYNNNYGR